MVSQAEQYYAGNFLVSPWPERQMSEGGGVYVMDNQHKMAAEAAEQQQQQQQLHLQIKSEQVSEHSPGGSLAKALPSNGVTVATISDEGGRTELKTTTNSGLLTPTNTSVISHTSQDSPDLDSSKVSRAKMYNFEEKKQSRKIVNARF